ncbi:cyclic nucleotide-gated channel alpha-3-like isoform X2 [Artemia franciscana]|uniref:cyclic nucleotide-gated channel alpha-3-like isoform X2 n=1 Tax=Artemia franciscana TaxID=6661 RepID=UPI0032D9BDC7
MSGKTFFSFLSGRRLGGDVSIGRSLRYTPCSQQELRLESGSQDLEEISVIHQEGGVFANGPRVQGQGASQHRGLLTSTPQATPHSYFSRRGKSNSKHSIVEGVNLRIFPAHGHLLVKRSSKDSMSSIQKHRVSSPAAEITRSTRDARRRDIRNRLSLNLNKKLESHSSRCKWTFVFDPAGKLSYYWSVVVSLAFLYNFWVPIYRFAFQEINNTSRVLWFCLDYTSDFLYILDIIFHLRTGYLEDGVLQTDSVKLRHHYMNSTTFYIDCLCLLPLDFLYLSVGYNSMLRCFRLVKIYRFWAFSDRTERHTNYPNVFRSLSLLHYLFAIFHWNACLYNVFLNSVKDDESDVLLQYLKSYYFCTMILTSTTSMTHPESRSEYFYVILQIVFGLMLFATVLGHVSNIVINVSAGRKEFQAKLDGVKTYMRMRRVPNHLQNKVIRWFDYLWLTHKSSDEEKAVGGLPDKLKAEIAIHVHLDTLKRVEIFQNTEAGFLCELVLRLRPVLFSPGDYICRKGEVGKEMYIVNRGKLQVVADDGKTVLATLKAGSYFGEISILNMGTAGNRRTASVRSVGYSDLFVLSKKDMWDVLKEYPAARVRLEAIAARRLEKYKKAPLEKAALSRSRSAPGLIESSGKISLEQMWLPPCMPDSAGKEKTNTWQQLDLVQGKLKSGFPCQLVATNRLDQSAKKIGDTKHSVPLFSTGGNMNSVQSDRRSSVSISYGRSSSPGGIRNLEKNNHQLPPLPRNYGSCCKRISPLH